MKIAVIGGGIAGLSLSYFLSKKGAQVEVFEKKYILYGSSGRNSGGVTAQFSDESLIKYALRTIELYENLQTEIGFNFLFRKSGYLKLSNNQQELEKEVEIQKNAGLKIDLLTPNDTKKVFSDLNTEEFSIASYYKDGGLLFPCPLLWGLAKGCRKYGVKIYDWTQAEIAFDNDKIIGVKTKNQVHNADIIVIAAGAWSKKLNEKIGIKCNSKIIKEEICVLESIKPYINPYIIHSNGLFVNQSMRGEIVGGIKGKKDSVNHGSSLDFLIKYAKLVTALIPKLRGLSVLRQWSGVYDETSDGKPNVGFSNEKIFQFNGFGRNGNSLAPAYAEEAAEIIMKNLQDSNR